LSIYRPQITSVLSIFHRITGAGLFFSSILFVIWISSVAVGLNYYNFVESIFSKPVILLILTVSLWALWYHSLTGLRHLYWDLGFGFDLKSVYLSGWIAILFSFFITTINIVVISYI
jgi:succinate dehydrogenase / fumarate reductase cytochrome b subunit